jgi:CMP-N-acetylneuraminic acid synthetase
MKDVSRIALIIQARVNSSRLPGKMILPFADSNLVEISIEKVKKSNFPISNFYLSIRDQEIIDISKKHGVNYYYRSDNSVRNDDVVAFTLPEVLEWWDKLDYDYYILMSACNPLLKISTLNSFVDSFVNSDYDSLMSVIEHRRFFFKPSGEIFQEYNGTEQQKRTFNTKFVEPIYSAGPLRAGKMSDIGKHIYMGDFNIPNSVPFFKYNSDEYIDIDYRWEFEAAQALYKEKKKLSKDI